MHLQTKCCPCLAWPGLAWPGQHNAVAGFSRLSRASVPDRRASPSRPDLSIVVYNPMNPEDVDRIRSLIREREAATK